MTPTPTFSNARPIRAKATVWLVLLLSVVSAHRRSGGGDGVFCSHHPLRHALTSTTRQDIIDQATIHSRRISYRSPADNTYDSIHLIQLCSSPAAATTRSIPATLARGAFLRILSDMSGATVFENVKCRVTVSKDTAIQAVAHIYRNSGLRGFWSGASSRTVEGGLVGAVFLLSSTVTKTQVKALGASPTVAALASGLVGGVAQALIMTPAGKQI